MLKRYSNIVLDPGMYPQVNWYTAGGFVWCDRPFYLVKQPKEVGV